MKRSLFDKIWDAHVVEELPGGNALVFMDLVVAHEITTPPGAIAIEKEFGDKLYEPDRIVAMIDHVAPAKDAATALQAQTVRTWAKRQGIRFHDIGNNGICHVLVPERGYVTPGMSVCCGDSHTCTLGALGAFALGIGTTAQAGAMLAGCLILQRPKVMRIEITGKLPPDATAKDLTLSVIATIGFRGGTGYVLEYTGSAVRALNMEQRMTLCNMAIEAGATTGIIAADATTAEYLAATPAAPTGWTALQADDDAEYAATVTIDGSAIRPVVSWGTNPGENAPVDGAVPLDAPHESLAYMDLQPGQALRSIAIDQAFIGSCTNSRIGDLRAAAAVLRGQQVSVPTIITPGSQAVRRQAEREGLHDIFQDAGALWTHSSCGPCLGMSMGVLAAGTRCVSSSNRNFPGRMGDGGRVHLAAPAVVAASAILGRIASPAEIEAREVVLA
ncbi:MAG TPA: aconitase/3-isopropylmalate dehydratase large subunit family protein [Candidatus Elarobacter sp.]|nr:aconitase/3-isopropylmalate dehydratase large subunit family protein [Candidatus Elarobacter sp.]HEV2741014.1 aconitase/3-isopropylmalate dehydratase large subunit family protein [Candidatus Elarobacter sp.]